MRVQIPPPLHSYTEGRSEVEASGGSLRELLVDLDARYPGIRFRMIDEQNRIRPHIKLFVNAQLAPGIDDAIQPDAEVQIICALSGG